MSYTKIVLLLVTSTVGINSFDKLTRSVNLRYPAPPVKAIKRSRSTIKAMYLVVCWQIWAAAHYSFQRFLPAADLRRWKEAFLRSSTGRILIEMFDLMLMHFGPQHWWPGETELEIVVGAILTQNTNWNNVEKAIKNLKTKNLLSMKALHAISPHNLAEIIRPAGYFNIKTGRLKNFIKFIVERYNGNISAFLREETDKLRAELISVKGIGPETADSILLYAAKRPVFVIDAYTHRILKRHDLAEDQTTYNCLQEFFMDNLPEDTTLFNEFHALIVQTGKQYCRRKTHCDICPLKRWGN